LYHSLFDHEVGLLTILLRQAMDSQRDDMMSKGGTSSNSKQQQQQKTYGKLADETLRMV
jgi:hypothetical protein